MRKPCEEVICSHILFSCVVQPFPIAGRRPPAHGAMAAHRQCRHQHQDEERQQCSATPPMIYHSEFFFPARNSAGRHHLGVGQIPKSAFRKTSPARPDPDTQAIYSRGDLNPQSPPLGGRALSIRPHELGKLASKFFTWDMLCKTASPCVISATFWPKMTVGTRLPCWSSLPCW